MTGRVPASDVPTLDGRDDTAVLTELRANVPGYSSYWRPAADTTGYALLAILSRYCELVIVALDGAVGKGQLAFLDALGIDLLPPQAARAPLVFTVNPDAPVDPSLAAGAQVAAPPAPQLATSLSPAPRPSPAASPDPIIFATDEGIALARARLATVYSTYPDIDGYADHSADLGTGFVLYNDLQPVTHHLYLGHDSLLALDGRVDVSLDFALDSDLSPGGTTMAGNPKLPTGLKLAWEYLANDGWVAFDPVDDHTYGLSLGGEVQVHKSCGPPASQGEVTGISSYWIRARMETPLPAFATKDNPQLPLVDTIQVTLALRNEGLAPDVALVDDLRIDTSKDFAPFGPQPGVSTSFLVACDQAFQQEGARIGIALEFTPGVTISPSADPALALFWEYSVAPGVWSALGGVEREFVDHTANLTAPTLFTPSVSFLRPADWAKVEAGGETHFWLRIRVAQGGYGGPPTYSIQGSGGSWSVVAANLPHPPILRSITFSYSFQIGPFLPDHCVTLNGFDHQDLSDNCRWGRPAFRPFTPLPDRNAAVYFGFDKPLPVGLVSLYMDVPGSGGSAFQVSPYVWECQTADGWSELAVLDETAGFVRSGLIQVIGRPDAIAGPGPAGPTFWLRARTKDAVDPDPSPVGAVLLNAVWATQHKAVQGEVLGQCDGTPRQALLTQHAPVLARQLLEVQEWHGTGREWESLFKDIGPDRLRYDRDARGTVTAVWVTWDERPQLYGSGPRERCYSLERSTGLVRFGDGATDGMLPPPGSPVVMSYDYEGGVAGNLPSGSLTQLYSAVPFVSAVDNPVVAAGGADGEQLSGVLRRGPQRLKNAGRSVASADYEWLAKEASPEVAVARCLPATGPDGPGEPGWVTVVIVPQGTTPAPQPSQELLRRVESSLSREAPAAIGTQILIVGPSYRSISVVAEVAPSDPSAAAQVEEALTGALNTFLHPVLGGPDGTGWEFGQSVELSQIVQVILDTDGVASASSVALYSDSDVFGDAVPIPSDALPSAGRHVLKLAVAA